MSSRPRNSTTRGYVPQTKSRSNVFLEYRQHQEQIRADGRIESIYSEENPRTLSREREEARAHIQKSSHRYSDLEMMTQLRQEKEDKYYKAVGLGLRKPIPGHSDVKLEIMKRRIEKEGGKDRKLLLRNRMKERQQQMDELKKSIRKLETHAKSTRDYKNYHGVQQERSNDLSHNMSYRRHSETSSLRNTRGKDAYDPDEPWDPINDFEVLRDDFADVVNGAAESILDMPLCGLCKGPREPYSYNVSGDEEEYEDYEYEY